MARRLTDDDIEFIVSNRLSIYPSDIAIALGLKDYQVRSVLRERNLDFKRKYGVERGFTPREEEIYLMLLKGYSLQDIANAMFLTRATIDTHTQNIMRKKMVNSRLELLSQRIKELEDELDRVRALNCDTQAS